jgi:hypothetical protein
MYITTVTTSTPASHWYVFPFHFIFISFTNYYYFQKLRVRPPPPSMVVTTPTPTSPPLHYLPHHPNFIRFLNLSDRKFDYPQVHSTTMGARDASVSRAPGMFFSIYIYIILQVDKHTTTTMPAPTTTTATSTNTNTIYSINHFTGRQAYDNDNAGTNNDNGY